MSRSSPETETLRRYHAELWRLQIISAGGDENVASQAIALAALNGLFDHLCGGDGVAQTQQRSAIDAAVQKVLATDKWPVNRDYDDAGSRGREGR